MSGITDSTDMSVNKFQEMGKDRESWHAYIYIYIVHGTAVGHD